MYPYHSESVRESKGESVNWPKIPWKMMLEHESQAYHNHRQTIHRLAEWGGMTPREILAVLTDSPYNRHLTQESALEKIGALVDDWNVKQGGRNAD